MSDDPRVAAAARAIDDEIGSELREYLGHIMRKWPNTITELAEVALAAADAVSPPMPASIEEVPLRVKNAVRIALPQGDDSYISDAEWAIKAFLAAWREQ
jgi:hypothetical protein